MPRREDTEPLAASIRTRGETATMQVLCSGETHTVTVGFDGSVTSVHDADADAVVSALGGPLHPCGKAVASVEAARTVFNALSGRSDLPRLTYKSSRGWRDASSCDSCIGGFTSLYHVYSFKHQVGGFGGYENIAVASLRWLRRLQPNEFIAESTAGRAVVEGLLRNLNNRRSIAVNGLYLSPRFIEHARRIVGDDASGIVYLRYSGATVDWVAGMSGLISPDSLAYVRRRSDNFTRNLSLARNVPPSKVAAYINAGITSHYHSYARVDARSEDVLAVYRGSHGEVTLADCLAQGMSIPDALRLHAA